MLTFEDCVGYVGITTDEAAAVAEHEHLTMMVAVERSASLLDAPWGKPALRQMIRDDLDAAVAHRQSRHAADLLTTLSEAERHLAGGVDRRLGIRPLTRR